MIDFHFAPTPNAMKIKVALEELGLPYRIIKYDLYQGEHLNSTFRQINPNVKIPAIVDNAPLDGGDPIPVFESGAILTYLAERCGALLPTDPRERLQAVQWLTWQVAGFGPMMGQAAHFLRYAPPGDHAYSTKRYVNESVRLLHVLDYRLKQADYLAGKEYSIADIACWPVVYFFAQYFEFDFNSLEAVRRWREAITARPAVQAALGSPDMAPGRYYDAKPVLTAAEWSNVFGERMLAASGVA